MSRNEHDELVRRAVKWLRSQSRVKGACGVAIPELVSYCNEQPDAIGWIGGGFSYMIECKVSRADFFADHKKFRQEYGVGSHRYYMCPPNLIKSDELPEHWGLLYCHPKMVTIEVEAPTNQTRNVQGELAMMYSLLRRVEIRGNLTRCLSEKWGGSRE